MAIRLTSLVFALFCFTLAANASAATLSKVPNNLGLAAYWSFDEGAGAQAADHSGRGNTALLTGSSLPTWTSGKVGKALNFDGSTSYFTSSGQGLNLYNDLTISVWINPSAWNNSGVGNCQVYNAVLEARSGGGVAPYGLYVCKNKVSLQQHQTSGGDVNHWGIVTPTLSSDIPLGAWTLITATRSGSNVVIYVNGVQVGSGTLDGPVDSTYGGLRVGKGRYDTDYFWNGKLDELKLYSRALSATEVASLYKTGGAKIGGTQNAGTLGEGLVGWWTMDGADVTDKVYDRSGQGNNGYFFGAATSSAKTIGKLGQALNFNGTNAYVTVPYSSVLAPTAGVTASAWFKYSGTTGTGQKLLSKTESGGYNLFLTRPAGDVCSGNMLCFAVRVGGSYSFVEYAASNLIAGRWYHLTGTYDGSAIRLYVNGAQVGTPASVSGAIQYTYNNPLCIGAEAFSADCSVGEYARGSLDDARVYNRGLSTNEVKQLYQQGNTNINTSSQKQQGAGLASGLVGLWTFDGPDITTAILDRSGNGLNGYLVGTNNATSSRKTIGKMGQGFLFGGQNTGGVNVGSSASLTPSRFTIAGWVKPEAPQTAVYNYIFSNTRDNCLTGLSGIELKLYSAGLLSGLICNAGSAISVSSSPGFATSTWAHVAFTYDGANMRLYKNGALLATQSNTTDPPTGSYNSYVGSMGHSAGTTYTFKGALDDVRLYSRALSTAEILQLYNLGK